MIRQGRKPNIEPRTAFDVRRYMTLIQVLASATDDVPIRALCQAWGVQPSESETGHLFAWSTIRALAQSVMEYHGGSET